ncbi:hypothetical protein F5X96DRAFT_664790 [Biscogniauxia mediterranea]|nr:hypothetical protein F5X96DRAFT_664790 [Biscogniauxia mediterranea]
MDPVKRLTDELCSLLDEATILSITSDYNLQDAEEFAAARQVLLTISKDVEAEEATGFNPSGIGADDPIGSNRSSQGAGRRSGLSESNDGLTVTTESSRSESFVSARSSQTSSPVNPGIIHVGIFDGLSDEEKENQLISMFVSLKPIDIKLTLEKCKGDASLAIDELLNLQWLEQTGQRPKGVDGFFVSDDDTAPSKKKKGKKKKTKFAKVATTPLRSPSDEVAPGTKHKQETDLENVTFLCDRLNMSVSEAREIYQRNNDSLGAAIIEMINNYIALGIQAPNSEDLPHVKEQAKRVPWIPREYINPIFEISPSQQSAVDVIDVLAGYIERPAYVKYNISYNLTAPDLEIEPIPISSASKSKQPAKLVIRPSAAPLQPQAWSPRLTSLESATAAAASLSVAKDHSYGAASSAFKRGRSDPLFRQAAAYYAERGRAQAASHREAARAEAGFRVDAQSAHTPDAIDLHDVTVRDGVDIALDRVRRWWDARAAQEPPPCRTRPTATAGGFTVITGLGRHSADGRSRLRVNVFKALVADGWKIQVLTGSYLVTGRATR